MKRIILATKYSLNGILAAFKSEAAFRCDVLIFIPLFFIALFLDIPAAEKCVLIIPLFLLLIAEILNTAVEKCVDLFTKEFNPLAKFAKDSGSAAVFFAIICIIVCWGLVFICKS